LYKAPLTGTVFKDFSALYQHFSPEPAHPEQAFVYVDSEGIKLVSSILESDDENDVFALSVAGDGYVEMLAVQK
jgi:hypothetical protein